MKNHIYILTIFCCITHFASSQTESKSLLGKKVPDLTFEQIINYDRQNAKLSDFEGKIVILDFWATWCRSCIKAFPHLEDLKRKFGEKIEILTITSTDSEERIERFLSRSKNKTTLPIVLDSAKVFTKQFPHRTMPHTVVIGADRITKVITSAENITEAVIIDLLNQKEVNIKEKKSDLTWSKDDHLSPDDAIFQLTLAPFKGGSTMVTTFENGRILMNGVTHRLLYEYANEFPSYTRTILEIDGKEVNKSSFTNVSRYSLEVIAPDKTEQQVRSILLDFLHNTLSLKSRVEKRKIPVKVLKRAAGPLKMKEAIPGSKEEFWFSGTGLHMKNGSVDKRFMRFFENRFAKKDQIIAVLDETGLSGNYDVDIPWYNEDPENIHKELKRLGLKLVDAEREIELLILYKESDTHSQPNSGSFE